MTTKSTKTPRKSPDVGVIVAIIGLIATIAAALINYASTRTQIELPISASQTAEVRASILTSTVIPTLSTKTPSSPTNSNWEKYIEIEKKVMGCEYIALPQDVDYSIGNTAETITQVISQGDKDNRILSWAKIPQVITGNVFPDNPQEAFTTFDINNISSQDWIEIAKSVTVSVSVDKDVPEKTNAFIYGWGCGGVGDTRLFPSLNLSTTFESYTDETTFPEHDFFTLQQGEFERFQFPFVCQSPGYYHLSFNIPFQIRSDKGNAQTDIDIICPKEVAIWSYRGSMEDPTNWKVREMLGGYVWNGEKYVSK